MDNLDIETFPLLPADEWLRDRVREMSETAQWAFMIGYLAQYVQAHKVLAQLRLAGGAL